MTIWVVGASGMLGKSVMARLAATGHETVVSTDKELDIADDGQVLDFASQNRPRITINCAAYTAVDAAEADESTAAKVNGDGPRNLARACVAMKGTLLHVSTDYVFPGEGTDNPYLESDATGPKNAYGRTKLLGELAIADEFGRAERACGDSRWQVLRTSWLFGDGASSFVETMWRLLSEKPELKVVSDQRGRPTYVEDLADALLRAGGLTGASPIPSGIWHFANAGVTTWHGLTTAIRASMQRVGANVRTESILPVSSAEFPRPARRPPFSVLDTSKIERQGIVPRPWTNALDEYIDRRIARETQAKAATSPQ